MKLIINFISKLGIESFSRLIGFITLPIITRSLGPDGYGTYSYLFVILSYFGFFIDFGYLNYGTNKLCEKADSEAVIGKIISLQLLTVICSYIILIITAWYIFDFEKYVLLLIFSLTYIAQIFSIRYYYLAENKLYFNSFAELIGQIIYASLIFLIFLHSPSVLVIIIISVTQAFVTAVILFLPYIRKNKIKINLNIQYNLITVKEAYKLGVASKAEGVTSTFIILCTGIFLNEQSVGLYNGAFKIYIIMLTVVQSISYTLMPKIFRMAKDNGGVNIKKLSLIFYIYVSAGFILSLVLIFFSKEIIFIVLGNKFSGSVSILTGFSITIFLMPVWMFLALLFLALNRYSYYLIISISSTVLSIIFSILMINYFNLTGAGYVLSMVSFCIIILSLYLLRKITLEENLSFSDFFSIKNAVLELRNFKLKNI